MNIFMAVWGDGTATLHYTIKRSGHELYDSTDQFGSCDSAEIFELIPTCFSPSEFNMKRVRITDDMRIVRDRSRKKNPSEPKR